MVAIAGRGPTVGVFDRWQLAGWRPHNLKRIDALGKSNQDTLRTTTRALSPKIDVQWQHARCLGIIVSHCCLSLGKGWRMGIECMRPMEALQGGWDELLLGLTPARSIRRRVGRHDMGRRPEGGIRVIKTWLAGAAAPCARPGVSC